MPGQRRGEQAAHEQGGEALAHLERDVALEDAPRSVQQPARDDHREHHRQPARRLAHRLQPAGLDQVDRIAGEQVGVDPVKFGMEVFLTRPSGSFTAAEMVGNDIKMFEPAGKKLLIGQYETVDKTRALGMIDEIREAMRAYAAEKGADGIVLCITDIMEEGSQVLLEGETEAAQKGLGIADEHDGVWMPGVLSRKKQVAAPIMAAC